MPYSAQQIAGLSAGQQGAVDATMQGVGAYQPFLQTGTDAIGAGIGAVGAGLGTIGSAINQTGDADFNFDPTSYQSYMNPYMNDVMDQQARTGSQLRSQGFQQAQSTAMQAAQQQAAQQLKQAQLTGQLGSTTGALGQTIGQLGTATAGLGQLGQAMGVQEGQAQRALDVERANDMARQALPYQQVGFMSDVFRGVPALQQTYSSTSAPGASMGSQMLGLGIAGLGAVGQAGGFQNMFGTPTPKTN